jgi:hypothetical protein
LAVAAVIVRALSDATKAATFPTSASVAARLSIVDLTIPSTIEARPSIVTLGGPPAAGAGPAGEH